MRVTALISLLALGGLTMPARAQDPGDALRDRWEGQIVIVREGFFSSCFGESTGNRLRDGRFEAASGRRFDAGELGRVSRLTPGRDDVALGIDLVESLLVPYPGDGFTIWAERECRVELRIDQPRGAGSPAAGDEARLLEILEPFSSQEAARASGTWNGRTRDPYPEGYEEALAEYARSHESRGIRRAATVVRRVVDSVALGRREEDDGYATSFAEGVGRGRDRLAGLDCLALAGEADDPPHEIGSSGQSDGEALAWSLEILRRLPECGLDQPFMGPGQP